MRLCAILVRDQNVLFVHCSTIGLTKRVVHGCLASLGLKNVSTQVCCRKFAAIFCCISQYILRVFGHVRSIVHNRIRKIETAAEYSGAAAKLFMAFCIPRLALPKNICLELMRIGWTPYFTTTLTTRSLPLTTSSLPLTIHHYPSQGVYLY